MRLLKQLIGTGSVGGLHTIQIRNSCEAKSYRATNKTRTLPLLLFPALYSISKFSLLVSGMYSSRSLLISEKNNNKGLHIAFS